LPNRAALVWVHLFADAMARQFQTGFVIAMGMVAFLTAASAHAVPVGDCTVKIGSASHRIEMIFWNGSGRPGGDRGDRQLRWPIIHP
jgi:hypothetical protein